MALASERVKVSSVHKGEVTVTGVIPADAFSRSEEHALKELGRDVSAPGFRTGHVPLEVLRAHIPAAQVMEVAVHMALEAAYRGIVKEHALRPLTPPQVTITSKKIVPGEPLSFSIRIGVFPAVKLPDYKHLAAAAVERLRKEATEQGVALLFKERDAALNDIITHTRLEFPALAVDLEVERIKRELPADYLEKIKKTEEAFFAEERERIAREFTGQLVMQAIAEAERITPDERVIAAYTDAMKKRHPDIPSGRLIEYARTLFRDEAVFRLLLPISQNATADTGPDKT